MIPLSLKSWGSNTHGQLGLGSSPTPPPKLYRPVDVANEQIHDALAISAGGGHSLAIGRTGLLYAWGRNDNGQCAQGPPQDVMAPVIIPTPGSPLVRLATAVSASMGRLGGGGHSLALLDVGQVIAWGAGKNGQLGRPTVGDSPLPDVVSGLSNLRIKAIAAGGQHSLALATNGIVYAWGANDAGQLGRGNQTPFQADPLYVQVSDKVPLEGVIAIAAGEAHSLALMSDGRMFAWGSNDLSYKAINPELPAGAYPYAIRSPMQGDAKAIACGRSHNIALTGDGSVHTWGGNEAGQAGQGFGSATTKPTRVDNFDVIATAVTAGFDHSAAILRNGDLYAWGARAEGAVGNGQPNPNQPGSEYAYRPTKVMGPARLVSAGFMFTLSIG